MKKALLMLALAAAAALNASAGPARPVVRAAAQPDGTTLEMKLTGDEFFHAYTTLDGLPLAQGAGGAWEYAAYDEAGLPQPTGILAHNAAEREADEIGLISQRGITRATLDKAKALARKARFAKATPLAREKSARRAAALTERLATAGNAAAALPARAKGNFGGVNYTGRKKGVVVLVNFADCAMQTKHTKAAFEEMLNGEGYDFKGSVGSVSDYFKEQSYGQFDVTFDVLGPVTLKYNMAYYGGNDRYGYDQRPEAMVREACAAVKAEGNWADYDWDGDGEVDQVFVFYAGYGEAAGADESTVWPHKFSLSEAGQSPLPVADGINVDTYACGSELNFASGTNLDGIGTVCHEYSHCLGLADAYDIDYSGAVGMAAWSIMSDGSYTGDGYQPCGYTAFERWSCGWLTPSELSEPCSVSGMKSIDGAAEAYVIYNEKDRNEFYLLENRQRRGFNVGDEGHGLLVTHLDYNESVWQSNAPNDDPARQRYVFVPADNKISTTIYGTAYVLPEDLRGDAYPGTSGNTALTNTSVPAARLNRANADGSRLLNHSIERIAEDEAGLVSFSFDGHDPTGIDAPQIDPRPETSARPGIFTLDGRRLGAVTRPGVYIVNGRKIIK